MKRKICALLLAAFLGLRVVLASVAVVASASVGAVIWSFLVGYFADKGLDALIDSCPYTPEYKFELLTALRDFCKEKNIDPNSDDFGDFLTFAMLEAPDNSTGQYSDAYGEDWSDLHAAVYPYISKLSTIYQMAWVDVQQWIIDHYNDVSTGFDDNGNVQIPVADLKTELEKENNTISPKNREMQRYSWRDLSPKQATENRYSSEVLARSIFRDDKTCFDTPREDGVYFQLYYMKDGVYYYAPYQFRIIPKKNAVRINPSDVFWTYEWWFEFIYYQKLDGESLDRFEVKLLEGSDYLRNDTYISNYMPYVSFGLSYSSGSFRFFSKGYSDFLGCNTASYNSEISFHRFGDSANSFVSCEYFNFSSSDDKLSSNFRSLFKYFLRADDVSQNIKFDDDKVHYYYDSTHYSDFTDWGFFVASEEFSQTYVFDVARLPSTGTVTISGDSVYDYSITDNSTGETSTIYNYITNNYSYPPSSGGNTSGGNGGNGGNIGGNITVGGQVDVGGKVDVNVNINNGGNGGNYSMPDASGMNDFLESALDESTGFRKFLKEFFDFLPPPILALLGVALTCAIIARLLGR